MGCHAGGVENGEGFVPFNCVEIRLQIFCEVSYLVITKFDTEIVSRLFHFTETKKIVN
jgi:hypothetical protein